MRKETLCETEIMLRRYPALQDKQSRMLRRWREAIDDTLAEYRENGEPEKLELLSLHYFNGCSDPETMQSLHIGRRTYYAYKYEVLCTAAFYAAKRRAL